MLARVTNNRLKKKYPMLKGLIAILFLCFMHHEVFTQQKKSTQKDDKTTVISDPATVVYKRKTSTPSASESKETPGEKPKIETPPKKSNIKYDTIIKLGGKKIPCTVLKVNPSTVNYSKPEQNEILEINRKDIEKIYYKSGRRETFNKPVLQMIDKTQWESVLVTENPLEVEGLYKVALIKANASSGSRSPKAAKQSATIRLQKKAANIGSLMVLITRSEMKGGYGEIPGWELEAIAYSDQPPKDTAAVNSAIRKAQEKARGIKKEKEKKK